MTELFQGIEPYFQREYITADEDELAMAKKYGKVVISTDESIECSDYTVTSYHYNGKIYIDEIEYK